MKISCQSCGAKYNIADEKVRGKIVKIACKKCGARIEIDGREPAEQAQDQDETRVFDQAQAPAPSADTWTVSIDDNDQREVTTAQLAELVQQGVATLDTFVWRDGMGDWQAVRDVAALQSVLGGASAPAPSAPPAAPAFPSEPPTAAYQAVQHDLPSNGGPLAAAAGGYGSPAIETSQPARLGGSRRGGAVDLFASQAAPPEEEEVATSAAAAGGGMFGAVGAAPMGGGKPIGARNENSVLFSLSALTASGPSPAPSGAPSDDEKSGLIDIQKLAASAKPTNGAKDDRAKLDDIMNLGGGGAFGSALGAPILAPPPAAALAESPAAAEEKKGGNKGLIIAMGGVVALLLVAVIVLLVMKKGGDETAAKEKDKSSEVAKADDKSDKGDKKPEKKDPAPGGDTAAPPSTETAPDPAGGPIGKPGTKPAAGAATGAAPKGTATAGAATTAAPTTTSPGTKCTTLDCMMGPAPKDPPKEAPKPSGAEFDKNAAVASLRAVPYKDCGSGGAGKVTVTFAPGGNVSSAVVTAGDYDGATKSCVQNRFKGAKVPAFSGDPKPVGWSISL